MDDPVCTATLTVMAPKEAGIPGRMDLAVLGLREEGDWCALALDLSVRGYGATFDEAFNELRDAVKAQITFALEHGGGDDIFFAAEDRYLAMYARARHNEVEAVYECWLARPSQPSGPEGLARPPHSASVCPKSPIGAGTSLRRDGIP